MGLPCLATRWMAALVTVLVAVPLGSCGSWPPAKACDPHTVAVQLSVNGNLRPLVRLMAGQILGLSDAVGWTFAVSDGRVLAKDDCPEGNPRFRAVQPGSSLLRASWEPKCRPACGMASRSLETTVIVDRASPLLPAVIQGTSAANTVALFSVGQTVEVALPTGFQYQPWQHLSISDPQVLHRVDLPTAAGIGLVVLQASHAGLADLTADARSTTSSLWEAGFFRIEFVVRDSGGLADVAATLKDGQATGLRVGDVLSLSDLPEVSRFSAGVFQSANLNQPLLIPLAVPVANQEDNGTRYFLAQAAGSERICWATCVAPAGIGVDVHPSAQGISVEATDSDGQKRFTLRPGEKIRLTLHPYIGPWQVVASSDAAVLRTTGNETSANIQRWTFEAMAPGSAILRATYPCPCGEACPLEPSIRVDVAAA